MYKNLIYIFLIMAGFSGINCFAEISGQPDEQSARCKAISEMDFSKIIDAPTQIVSSSLGGAKDGSPAYCEIQGYVTPSVGFGIRVPTSNWSGKVLMLGCGGWCGTTNLILDNGCKTALQRGYACVTTDMGHKSTLLDAKWAYNNLQGKIDFAFRATHVTALAAKAIAARYYGSAPQRSYLIGCSQGGRQAMMSAQRFPDDFDGIVAVAPPMTITSNISSHLWGALALSGKDGKSILDKNTIERVHRAVLEKCDLDDGVKDGVVSNPPGCTFQPSDMLCKNGNKKDCLSQEQVTALDKIYQGPVNSKGELMFPGAPKGSELYWIAYLDPKTGMPDFRWMDVYRYVAFMPDAGPNWKPTDFDFDKDYARMAMAEALLSTTNPDMSKFRNRGGKLIAVQGWADTGVPAPNFNKYYETVERTMGPNTRDFFRLFNVPGMHHCSGGEGAYNIDYLSYLDNWVEKGLKPDSLLATRPINDDRGNALAFVDNGAVDKKSVKFSRPIYPYPLWAKYKGTGDVNDAENFEPYDPRHQ